LRRSAAVGRFIFVYARIVIYLRSPRQWLRNARPAGRLALSACAARLVARFVAPAIVLAASPVHAQWRFASSPAASAWYDVLDSLRLSGRGALALTRTPGDPVAPLARTLAAERFDILQFAPLYYPSATAAALADALEDAAGTSAPRVPRAQFLVGAIRTALPDPRDRLRVAELAGALRRTMPQGADAARLAAWQSAWDRRFAVALTPFLARERLDGGVIWIVPALGPEGRLFAGVPADRHDNVIAISEPFGNDDADGPLFAAVRELCFPLVSRVADRVTDFTKRAGGAAQAARRASTAAVRCGAALLDQLAPAESDAYRAHWLRVGGGDTFDALYPPDPVLTALILAALSALPRSR